MVLLLFSFLVLICHVSMIVNTLSFTWYYIVMGKGSITVSRMIISCVIFVWRLLQIRDKKESCKVTIHTCCKKDTIWVEGHSKIGVNRVFQASYARNHQNSITVWRYRLYPFLL